jgi:arylsulfatase A-like enzyme
VARNAAHPWADATVSEYCSDAAEPWAGATPVQQRMLRTRRWKLNYYHGDRPQLYDMREDPRETTDLADDARHAGVRDALVRRVLAGWDPEHVGRRMAARRRDKAVLGAWARAVRPPDAYRWRLRMEDNWLDPPRGAT